MKKLLTILLSLLMIISLAACNSKDTEKETVGEYYPVTIIDQAQREITIDSTPIKVVSGYYISTSLLIALNQNDKLVGIEAKANKRPIYKLSAPELIELPNVGSAKEFDLEGCIALEPDLVILPLKLKEAANTMSELGINVILVNPESEELLNEMINTVSIALNCKDEANKLFDFVNDNKSLLNDLRKNIEPKNVYLAGNSDVLSTAGKNMYQNTMLELAGVKNVAEEIEDNYWATISLEQLLTYNPDYIVIASEAEYTVDDVINNPDLQLLDAVKNNNVIKLPSAAESWDSPVTSSVLGSAWIMSNIYPDVLSKDKCSEMINAYYETFYKFTYPQD